MKATNEFMNKRVLVLGLAKSGTAAAQLLRKLGAEVIVNDAKPYEQTETTKQLEKAGVALVCGGHPIELLDRNLALIVKNPGIRYDNPLVAEATKRQIPIVTEIELAAQISEAEIIAITGSNGKTTTTTLIYEMLKESRRTPLIAGNIGTVACQVAEEAKPDDIIVMEVSSFQLMGTIRFQPKVAILLNIFDAHLDYHGTKDEYIDAKSRVFQQQTEADVLIYNADDPLVSKAVTQAKAQLLPFSRKRVLHHGLSLQNGAIYDRGQAIIELEDIVLPGEHNLESIMAAVGAAVFMGATRERIRHVLQTFNGVEHRLQHVKTIAQRLFYNDSKATNILATKTALAAFTQPTILLAGGLDRGNSFDELVPSLRRVKTLITFGETKEKLAAAAEKAGVERIRTAERVADAVALAFEHSEEGDVILLSPACASWDQYPTFEVRGQEFVEAVSRLNRR